MDGEVIAAAVAEEERLRVRLAELEAEGVAVERELAKLIAFREVYDRLSAKASPVRNHLSLGDLSTMTIAGGAEAVLVASGGRAKTTEIIAQLIRAGKMKRGKSRGNYGTLTSTLSRKPEKFEKVGPGLWGMVRAVTAEKVDLPTMREHLATVLTASGLGNKLTPENLDAKTRVLEEPRKPAPAIVAVIGERGRRESREEL